MIVIIKALRRRARIIALATILSLVRKSPLWERNLNSTQLIESVVSIELIIFLTAALFQVVAD